MPKKHRQTYPTNSPRTKLQTPTKQSLTVNERLSNLRTAQPSSASNDRKRQLAEQSNQKSLPPSLGQGILGQSATAAPNPRNTNNTHVLRSRIRLRTPGPPPPPSWLSTQTLEARYHAAPRQAVTFGNPSAPTRTCPEHLARFLNMANDNPVVEPSLLDMSLKAAARNWLDIVQDCFDSLDLIPPHLRVVLLSYLTTLGPTEGIGIKDLHALFPNPAEASSLDLSGLVGWGFSLKELRRWLHKSAEESKNLPAALDYKQSAILDSWDQDSLSDQDPSSTRRFSIPKSLEIDIQHLTKLSLAYPPSSISWTDLLALSKDLHTITHLSLAHWPFPTRTPNSTSPYASLDRDFEESALVLRILASNTYCLRWLDLQGCHSWLGALTYGLALSSILRHTSANYEQEINNHSDSSSSSSSSSSDWTRTKSRHSPKSSHWNTSWRHLTYLNLSQPPSSWLPFNTTFLASSVFRTKMAQKYFWLTPLHRNIITNIRDYILLQQPERREFQIRHCGVCHGDGGIGEIERECGEGCGACMRYQDEFVALCARWLEREMEARTVAKSIIAVRKVGGGGVRCSFDHGWECRQSYPTTS
jgi:hypothetical protein